MAELKLVNEAEVKARWVQFDEDTEVNIRLMSKPALRKISQKAEKRAALTKQDRADVADGLLVDEAVLGWRKIGATGSAGFVVKGNPFPYSKENARLLMAGSLKFSRFVNTECVDEDSFEEDINDSKNG